MIAIDPAAPGGPEVLQPATRPVPLPGAGEVLIRVAAAGVNRPDVLRRRGMYPPPPGAPSIPGLEVAGDIIAVGDGVDPGRIGQRVCALVAGGGYAEYCAAPLGQCLPVPDAISMIEAAAMPETLFTVWTNLFERAYAAEGDTVLVHGGTSGIGTMAIALGKLFGLTVIVTCGSDGKCARARELGADHAINYATQDFVSEVQAITGGKGVQVVLDMVGGSYVQKNLDVMNERGRVVMIAFLQGPTAQLNLMRMMLKRLTLTGSTLRSRSVEEKARIAAQVERNVWPWIAAGRVKPVIDSTFPLTEAEQAHARLNAGAHAGKVVLTT